MFDYFTGNEHEQYLFLQVPILLIKDPMFKPLSDGAILLYGLLLNRTSLSIKNDWKDENGNVYIIYTLEEIQADLRCSEKKAIKITKELKEIGLIESVRRGLNKPNLIYVKNFASVLKYKKEPLNPVNTRNTLFDSSRTSEKSVQEHAKLQTSNIDFKKIYSSDIESQSQVIVSYPQSPKNENQKIKNDLTLTSDIDHQEMQQKYLETKKEEPSTPIADQSTGLESPSANSKFNNNHIIYEKQIKDNIFSG